MDRRSSGEQVAAHIRRMIFDGELRVGERVRQDDIASDLGVSRIPVREALIALDREGWLTIEPHRGAYVNGLDERSVRDHYEVFGLVYGLAARKVTERATAAELADLDAVEDAFVAAVTPEEVLEANDAVFALLFDRAASPRLSSLRRLLAGIVPGNFFESVPGALEAQREGLPKVLDAVRAGDGPGAEEACRALMGRQGDLVVALLAERHVLPEPAS